MICTLVEREFKCAFCRCNARSGSRLGPGRRQRPLRPKWSDGRRAWGVL